MKRHAPATARNSSAIAQVLACELPESGTVLELASGSGEHAVYFAREFSALNWLPSDVDTQALASIAAWRTQTGASNILAPVRIDAAEIPWPVSSVDAIFCCNMVHISPWRASEGAFQGAQRILGEGMPLIFYGPFLEEDIATAPSNQAFDYSLRQRNAQWGLRSREALDALAQQTGFTRTARFAMPANNLMLTYRKI